MRIIDKLRRKKKVVTPQLERKEFFQIVPFRNPNVDWKKDEKGLIAIIITVQEQDEKDVRRKRKGVFSRILAGPKEKTIQLDMIGSIVWEMCDGEMKVKDIIDKLDKEYKMLPSESELSLSTYFNSLAKRGLLGFKIPKKIQERISQMSQKE